MSENSVIYGPLCMNLDVIDEGEMLPPLKRGTRLILSPVGAYNNTQWMQFITYRPNVVLIGENGEVDVIREAEDLTDITLRERMPERLAQGQSE
jgi:diaminopimelate decarboxylase